MAITIRRLVPSDRDKLCDLFTEFSDYQRDRDFWLWINRKIGSSESVAVVAESASRVVAHYAIVPHEIFVKGRIVKAGLGIHAFIHPEFRGKILMYKLTQLAYESAKDLGINFVYGFPNSSYREIQKRIEGWQQIALFRGYEVELNSAVTVDWNYELVDVANTTNDLFDLDELLQNKVSISSVRIYKNLRYFMNRYLLHPQQLYQLKFVVRDGKKVGLLVFKIFEGNKGHLIDFVRTDLIAYRDILTMTIDYFKYKVAKLIIWPVNPAFDEVVREFEYSLAFETFLGVKFLVDNKETDLNALLDIENWELMMGDSDAF